MKQQIKLIRSREQSPQPPVLSPDQEAVVGLASGTGAVLVLGGPGTGKSTVLVETILRRVDRDALDPADVLLLAPTRLSAARLRDKLTGRLGRSLSSAPARSWASYSFDLIRRAKAGGYFPHISRAPRLLSGAEQDLIIKELLEGHGRNGVPNLPWPRDLDLARQTRGFRQEIRQLFDRVSEYGLGPDDLVDYGAMLGRPDWEAAAALYGEYRDVLDIRMPEAFDPAGIITTALDLLITEPRLLDEERRRFPLLALDDLQEANPAIHQLLAVLRGGGGDVLMAACPDTVVQGFRGARPDLLGSLGERMGVSLRTELLITSHRLRLEPARAWRRVADRISVAGVPTGYRDLITAGTGGIAAPAAPARIEISGDAGAEAISSSTNDIAGSAEVHVLDSELHELRYVCQRILQAQLLEGRSLERIAVIVRSGRQVATVQRYLTGQGIDVHVPATEKAVRDEAAVRPLLEVFAVVLDPELLTPELAVSLLTSRIGGASTLELRRLRQVLRREELSAGGGRASDALLMEALTTPGQLQLLGWEARSALRLARMLEAGKRAAADAAANAESVLWALWDSAGVSKSWADAALGAGPAAARADGDLDAMMALFHAAERYVDQLPGATPVQFLEYLTSQEIPMDTLAARAQGRESVEILTPAAAAGREWEMVIVAGVQEGIWPDLRLRGELLGSGELSAVVEHGKEFSAFRDPLTLMHATRFDELRSFATAISRASQVLVCTAVSAEDAQPSQFLDLIAPLPAGVDQRPSTRVLRPLSLRGLVADYRKSAQEDNEAAQDARRQLGRMVRHRPVVPGAAPEQWWGLLPMSAFGPIVPDGEPVYVSPSKVEAVLSSPLDWFVSAAGGEPARDFARSLGTLVHEIAQDLPTGTGTEYVAELHRRWPKFGMKENWEGQLDLLRAETMVRKLAGYVLRMRQEGRSLLAVESSFSTELPAVRDGGGPSVLRGQVDRIELVPGGKLHIVDLKTGKSSPAKDDLVGHPQLAAYQVAVNAGAFSTVAGAVGADSGGAALVQLGTGLKDAGIQSQDALDPSAGWAREMVLEAAGLMTGSSFEAVHDPKRQGFSGHGCRLPEVCPLCPEGKQVTE